MDNRGSKDSYTGIFLVIVGAAAGYFGFVVTQRYSEWYALPVFILDAFVMAILFYAIRNVYRNRMYRFIQEVVQNVRKVSNGQEMDKPKDGVFSSEIGELYDTINTLNKSLIAQSHSKDNVIEIINSIAFNIELEKLLEVTMPKIVDGTKSNWGAFYVYNSRTEKFELNSSIGFTKSIYKEFDIALGDGFVGTSAQSGDIKIFNDIPDDTIYISKTFLGKIKPRAIMTVPVRSEGEIAGVLLLASIYDYGEEQLEIVKLIRYYMGSAVTNGITYERTKRLKNELLFQNQLIQNMNEELEHKVEERTRFLNNVLNEIDDCAIISMDRNGRILLWNKGAEALRGFTQEEVIGKHISETYIDENSEGPARRLEMAEKEGKFEDFCVLAKTNGENLYAHRIVTSIYNGHGDIAGFTTIIKDMTGYRLLNEKASLLSYACGLMMEREKEGVVVTDGGGAVVKANEKAAELLGKTAAELEGTTFASHFGNDGEAAQRLQKCLEQLTDEVFTQSLKSSEDAFDIEISLKGGAIPETSEKMAVVRIRKK